MVLVRAYADRPFVGQVYSIGPNGLRVARAGADLDSAATLAAGISWEDAFEVDKRLVRELQAASRQSVREKLWRRATPLRRNFGNESEQAFGGRFIE